MSPHSEATVVRIRALLCALLQLMLLAIWPVAVLVNRSRRGSHAELVSAVIERVGIEHRYVFEWDLGPASVTPDRAMAVMQAAPDSIFPFSVSGGIEPDRVLQLDDVRWPRDNGNPVLISQADSTSFTFLTLPGHFRGPGRTIQFTILARGGRLILRQVGATSLGISDMAYDGGAWFSWRTQAATLRSVLLVGDVPAPRHRGAGLVELVHGDVGHEAVGSGAVPVVLAGLEEHAVAGAENLDRAALPLTPADSLGDEDRLAVRVRVPRVDVTGEPVRRALLGLNAAAGDLQGRSLASSLAWRSSSRARRAPAARQSPARR
jgi:hypothetical protein